jgi:hypothetical protein
MGHAHRVGSAAASPIGPDLDSPTRRGGLAVPDSIETIGFPGITPQLARESGFRGAIDLLKAAKHGKGENIYLVRFVMCLLARSAPVGASLSEDELSARSVGPPAAGLTAAAGTVELTLTAGGVDPERSAASVKATEMRRLAAGAVCAPSARFRAAWYSSSSIETPARRAIGKLRSA